MNEINEEIKLTLNLMQTDIDDGAHGELQGHLAGLLEIKRNELQQRLAQRGLKAIEKTVDEELVFFADKMILTNADGAEVLNTDWPNPFVNPDLRADSKVSSPFSEQHSKAVHQPIPEELSAMLSSFFKGFGRVRVGNAGGEVLIDTEWPNPLVNPDQHEAHRRMAEWVDTFSKVKEDRVPLTADELRSGGWWCADTSEDALKAFILYGLETDDDLPWDGSFYGCFLYENGRNLLDRGYEDHTDGLKQIKRKGNEFYWSEK